MSGGAFGYPHFDSEQLVSTIREMQSYAEENEEIHPEVYEQLRDVADALEDSHELFRRLDRTAAGDNGSEYVNEVVDE